MSTYRLSTLFAPRSVAVIGVGESDGSLGRAVLTKIRQGGFPGRLSVVHPGLAALDGIPCVPTLGGLDHVPDVVVVATPPSAVATLIEDAAGLGVAAAIIVSGGIDYGPGSAGERIATAARRTGLRLVGPNAMGVVSPRAHFDASFAARPARVGDLALISQSGAIAAAMLEWAHAHDRGFSGFLSLGDKIDIDFADMLDYFAEDRATRAILLYVEQITNARKFMSAARAAARVKPVVVVRSGRYERRAEAGITHAARLAQPDDVYDAAFRRAGLLRVYDLDEMFSAAETLSQTPLFTGDRLMLLTNGCGLGRLAEDRLVESGGRLAPVTPALAQALDAVIPSGWSRRNPVDLEGSADAATYATALRTLIDAPETDAILLLHSPSALASTRSIASAVGETVKQYRARSYRPKPVFTVWAGEQSEAAAMLGPLGIPSFSTEAQAVRSASWLIRYRKAQDTLLETPPSLPRGFSPDRATARAVIAKALGEGRSWLPPEAITALLRAYAIPVAALTFARTPREAAMVAQRLIEGGNAVALKILSDDLPHKSEVGGVVLGMTSHRVVEIAAHTMLERVTALRPEARIDGFVLQPTIRRQRGRELIAGIADDPVFGPIIVFGRGGTAVEVIDDKALALPPLDLKLASEVIARTRVSRQLDAYQDTPAADREAVALVLVKLAQLSADCPEIRELDLNPLVADHDGVIALDARIRVVAEPAPLARPGNPRFAVKPYPSEWDRMVTLKDGSTIRVRPVLPEDEPLYVSFFNQVTPEDLRLRFFAPVKDFSHGFIARLTQLDYARAIALAAIDPATGALMGVVRLHADANHEEGEYAILLRSDLKGRGLGWRLMQLMIAYAKADGLKRISGQILRENSTMLSMVAALGFTASADPDDPDLRHVVLDLDRITLPDDVSPRAVSPVS
jgi:acetyltransferase